MDFRRKVERMEQVTTEDWLNSKYDALSKTYDALIERIIQNTMQNLNENLSTFRSDIANITEIIFNTVGENSLFFDQIQEDVERYFRERNDKYELSVSYDDFPQTYVGYKNMCGTPLLRHVHSNILIRELTRIGINARRITEEEERQYSNIFNEIRLIKKKEYEDYILCALPFYYKSFAPFGKEADQISEIVKNYSLNMSAVYAIAVLNKKENCFTLLVRDLKV